MKRFALLGALAALSIGAASADVVTLEEHSTNDTPVIDLSTIINQWGTPSDTTSAFVIGGTGTDGIAGLNILNDLGFTITSLEVYAYGDIVTNNSTFKYNCGVNNFFDTCSPKSSISLASGTTVPMDQPLEWDYFGLTTHTGIGNGTEFRLVDSVDGTLGSNTTLFYKIGVTGGPAVPEPSNLFPAAAGLLVIALIVGWKRKPQVDSSSN